MKKTITLIFAVLAISSLQAQVKIGENPTTINENSLLEMETKDKGMLLPRVELEETTKFEPLKAHIAGMTVYNTATSGDVTPGYYYNDGTKWVRLADANAADATKDAWVDEDAENRVSLNYASLKDNVYYTENGLKVFDKTNPSYTSWDYETFANKQQNKDEFNTYNYNQSFLKNIPLNKTFTIPNQTEITANRYDAIADASDTNKDMRFYNTQFYTQVTGENPNSYESIEGIKASSTNSGTGKVNNIRGAYFDAVVGKTSFTPNAIRGLVAVSSSYSDNNTKLISGIQGVAAYKGAGTVTSLVGIESLILMNKTVATNPAITGNITNMLGMHTTLFTTADVSATVENMYGNKIRMVPNAATHITNAYGLYLDNMPTHPTGEIFSIYTNRGYNYFGDRVGILTKTPESSLSVKGNAAIGTYAGTTGAPTNGLIVSGKVGIGTDAPAEKLSVAGNIETLANNWIIFQNANTANKRVGTIGVLSSNRNALGILADPDNTMPNSDIAFWVDGKPGMTLNSNQELMVGDTSFPAVSATIHTRGTRKGIPLNTGNRNNSILRLGYKGGNGVIDFGFNPDAAEGAVGGWLQPYADGWNLISYRDLMLNPLGGNVSIGTGTTNQPAAKFEVNGYIKVGSSDAKGDATPKPGMIRYNEATDKFQGYTSGSGWVDLH